MPIDDEIVAAQVTTDALASDDTRLPVASAQLDVAADLVAQARAVANGPDDPAQQGGVAQALLAQARAALDLAVMVVADPPKQAAPKRAGRKK